MAAARGAIDARFRLHGRDPATGLDCVGLAVWALKAGGFEGAAPSGYALRGGDRDMVSAMIGDLGLMPVTEVRPGDLVLVASGAGQLHLVVISDDGFVHADAGLRRVVERPGAAPWPVIGCWRFSGQHADRTGPARSPPDRP